MNLHLPVDSISDTAFVTAYCRALESERADAHFRDPYARQLAGTRGQECVERLPGGKAGAAGCVVRTILVDEFVLHEVRSRPVDGIVNLGAGLDTRPFRLPIPTSVQWYDVDSPEVLQYKARQLLGCRPVCAYHAVEADLADPEEFDRFLRRAAANLERILILTEGVLIYLTCSQVERLASALYRSPAVDCWITDLASPNLLELGKALDMNATSSRQVTMKFAPADGHHFFRPCGWQAETVRSCLEEGRQFNRWTLSESVERNLTSEQWEVLRTLTTVVKLRRQGPTPGQTAGLPMQSGNHP